MYATNILVDEVNCANAYKVWKHWCRLCAREDAQNVNVFFKDESLFTSTESPGQNEHKLITAIQKYFSVHINKDGQFPNELCPKCFSLVTYLIHFNNRVAKVQEMFFALQNTDGITEENIRALRLKYQILAEDPPNIEINDNGVENFLENVCTEEMIIKKENRIDVTSATDEDVCDFENDDAADEDPFGSDKEVANAIDDGSSGKNVDEEEMPLKEIATLSRKKTTSNRMSKTIAKEPHIKDSATELTESTECKYFCSKCPQSFQRIGSYRLHLNKKHGITEIPTYSCPKCSRSFKNGFNLKRHIETHRPKSEKKIYPCPQCDRKFQTKVYVATHIKFVHEDIRPLICEECGEGVRTQGALREHMLTHTDYAPFECEVCKKSFKNQSRLKNHMEIHSSDKHTCSECGLQLNSRVTLNRHMLVHSDVMHHKCDYCGRAFKRAKTLKSHLILHSGIKPYSCEFCDRTFTSGSNCRTHMKRAHPSELAEMEAAGEKKYTKNIPKLAVLKSVMKKAENLIPVVSKASGNFACKKRVQQTTDKNVCANNVVTQDSVATSAYPNT